MLARFLAIPFLVDLRRHTRIQGGGIVRFSQLAMGFPNPVSNFCRIFSPSSFCFVTSSFYILFRTNKSSLSSDNPEVQSTASFQPVVE